MHRLLVHSLAAVLLLLANGLVAQTAPPRSLLVPQFGAVVRNSEGDAFTTMASLAGELAVGRRVAVMAEGTTALMDPAIIVCHDVTSVCRATTGIRAGAAAGVVVRPFQLGRFSPYAGASAGVARWARDGFRGMSPLTSVRAGVDVRVAGPFGVRADLVRRTIWPYEDERSVHADVFSLGAAYALRQ